MNLTRSFQKILRRRRRTRAVRPFETRPETEPRSKRGIYAEMLRHGILSIRSLSKHSAHCFTIADLLHNVPPQVLHEDFDDLDFYFLNVEVNSYINTCRYEGVSPDPALLAMAAELRRLVPDELKFKLEPCKYEKTARNSGAAR